MTNKLQTEATLLAPFSQEAEEAVVGAVMISPPVFDQLQSFLQGDHFYLTRHRLIWNAFVRLAGRHEVMDLTTIAEELRQMGTLDEVGGPAYLVHLINNTPNSMHAEAYARLVERTATRRKLLIASDEIRKVAMDEGLAIESVLAHSEMVVLNVAQQSQANDSDAVIEIDDAVDVFVLDVKDSIQLMVQNPNYTLGVRTGLSDLDRMIDGLRPGDVVTVAGSTSMGKTAYALTVALNASRTGICREDTTPRPANVLVFSGEMGQKQIMTRLASSKTGYPVRNIERGNLTKSEQVALGKAVEDLRVNHALAFVRSKRLDTIQIRRMVRQLVMAGALDLFVLDGLLQLEYTPKVSNLPRQRRSDSRRDDIESIMNELEDIAATYQISFLLTHQISRAPAQRQNKRPQLSDLAEASFVEQKSAVVLFVYRDAYYNTEADPNAGEIIVAKNRHGETGTIQAYYNRQFTRWQDADVQHFSLLD